MYGAFICNSQQNSSSQATLKISVLNMGMPNSILAQHFSQMRHFNRATRKMFLINKLPQAQYMYDGSHFLCPFNNSRSGLINNVCCRDEIIFVFFDTKRIEVMEYTLPQCSISKYVEVIYNILGNDRTSFIKLYHIFYGKFSKPLRISIEGQGTFKVLFCYI